MARRLRLRDLQALVDVTHADLSRQQQPENPQPGRIGQGLEQGLHVRQLSFASPYICLDKYTTAPYSGNIRLSRYKETDMSDIATGRFATVRRHCQFDRESSSEKPGCCGPLACGCSDPITSNLYSDAETSSLPAEAVAASLGCGNPTALLALEPGQTVLDLGSGGGIDVLLSAKRVGPVGQGLRSRHDRRDAGARAREPAKGRRDQRRVPERARSRRFRCPTTRSTSSSPTA